MKIPLETAVGNPYLPALKLVGKGLELDSRNSDNEITNILPLDRELAPIMFVASLLFLLLLSGVLHLNAGDLTSRECRILLQTLGIVYLVFPLELLLWKFQGGQLTSRHWLVAVLPPLRLATPDHAAGSHLWLPGLQWKAVDRDLERQVTETFSWPMIGLALLVMPLIIGELLYSEAIEAHPIGNRMFQGATAVIWAAFVMEFVLLFSLAENKLKYLARHWLDVVVICLPLVAFLRTLRLTQLLRLNQVTKTVRLYRMRGVLIRTWRAIVTMDLLERILLRNPAQRIQRLEQILLEKERELQLLQKKLANLKGQLAPGSGPRVASQGPNNRETLPQHASPVETVQFHSPDILQKFNSEPGLVSRSHPAHRRSA